MQLLPIRRLAWLLLSGASLQTTTAELPTGLLSFGGFEAELARDGAVRIEGAGWPTFTGTWRRAGDELTLTTTECPAPGRYRIRVESGRLHYTLIEDECHPRRMILDGSTWRPAGENVERPNREIVLTRADDAPPLPEPSPSTDSWPSFRGPRAAGVADGQHLPDTWDGVTGRNVLWKTPIPGLAHSSPIVWGDTVFVTSAVSSREDASFRPGLYGDGDASEDRSPHQWKIIALDKRSGRPIWERSRPV